MADVKLDVKQAQAIVQTKPVKVNVGGTVFLSSKATLTKEPSALSAFFDLTKEEPTEIFLDRNPSAYPAILDYLRDGSSTLAKYCAKDLAEIEKEAKFLALGSLIHFLDDYQVFVTEHHSNIKLSDNRKMASLLNVDNKHFFPIAVNKPKKNGAILSCRWGTARRMRRDRGAIIFGWAQAPVLPMFTGMFYPCHSNPGFFLDIRDFTTANLISPSFKDVLTPAKDTAMVGNPDNEVTYLRHLETHYDTEKKTISFIVNQKKISDVITNIPAGLNLVPVIVFGYHGDFFTIENTVTNL